MTIPTDGRIDLDALAELANRLREQRTLNITNHSMVRVYLDEMSGLHHTVADTLDNIIDLARRAEAKADDRPDPTPNAAFDAWVASLPKESWAKYDLSACRLGWDAARRAAIPSEQGEAVGVDFMALAAHLAKTNAGRPTIERESDGVVFVLRDVAIEAMQSLLARDAHHAPAAGVKVKALEWSDDIVEPLRLRGGRTAYAYSVFGTFQVWGDGSWVLDAPSAKFHVLNGSMEDGKAAAQADYEARILSALDQGEPK